MNDRTEIARLLTLSEDDLLAEVGSDIMAAEGLSGFPSRQRAIGAARDWMARNLESLRSVVCTSAQIRLIFEQELAITEEVALAICTSLAEATIFRDVPLLSLSAILVKRGVPEFCGWSSAV